MGVRGATNTSHNVGRAWLENGSAWRFTLHSASGASVEHHKGCWTHVVRQFRCRKLRNS